MADIWTATLSSKGQLVLPRAVRDKLGARPGTKIVLAEREGHIEMRAYGGGLSRWYGAATVEGPQDWEAVKEAAGRARAEEVVREAEGD
jgi:AbrB family looped-hinge helix DNA binding protein